MVQVENKELQVRPPFVMSDVEPVALTQTEQGRIHKVICNDLNELYERKNRDYGNSFSRSFDEYGLTMSAIRLEDKLSRLKALVKNGDLKVKDESIIDTLKDLANYSIMTIMELEKAK